MKTEIEKVLMMVQEGKVNAEKGSELIEMLKEREFSGGNSAKPVAYTDKVLKIRVVSADNDNVSVNLPIKLIKVLLKAGYNIAGNIPQSEKYVKDLDIDIIIEAIENELDGQLVDVKSADGDTVSIVIE